MIKHVTIVNYKNIELIELDLVKAIYFITGENDTGKSHLIEALVNSLTGDRSADILMKGKESGKVETLIEVGGKEFTVRLAFSKKNPRGTLTIKGEGVNTDNKSFLQSICQHTDFDAGEFLQWSETADGRRRQINAVKSLLSVEIQAKVEKLDGEIFEAKESRKTANTKVNEASTLVDAHRKENPNLDAPGILKKGRFDRVAVVTKLDGLYENRRTLRETNTRLSNNRGLIETWTQDTTTGADDLQKASDILSGELKGLKNLLAAKQLQVDHASKGLINYRDKRKIEKDALEKVNKTDEKFIAKSGPEITSQITEKENKLATGDAQDTEYKKAAEFTSLVERQTLGIKEQVKAQTTLNKLSNKRTSLIKSGNVPVEGLTFDSEQLFLNDLPFTKDVVSTSQMIQVACALQFAANKKTGVFKVMNGESLGKIKLKAIIDFGKANGFQGFIEEMRRGQEEIGVELIEKTGK